MTPNCASCGRTSASSANSTPATLRTEKYVGRLASDLLHFEGANPQTRQHIHDGFAAGRGLRFEILARSKDGHVWWLDTDARPLTDSAGELKGWAVCPCPT